ncbi:fasciclin domain-containing protein [Tsuneonella sp. HG222]
MRKTVLAALAASSLAMLGACSQAGDDAEGTAATAEPSTETLAQALGNADGMNTVATALGDVGLAQVFDGAGSYTILVPNDAAFEKLGDAGKTLLEPEQRAAMAAVLRDHIVVGYLEPADIETAIESKGGAVEAKTMGGHKLTFSKDGDAIVVTSEDGSRATVAGDAVRSSNGVAIPMDGLLKKLVA